MARGNGRKAASAGQQVQGNECKATGAKPTEATGRGANLRPAEAASKGQRVEVTSAGPEEGKAAGCSRLGNKVRRRVQGNWCGASFEAGEGGEQKGQQGKAASAGPKEAGYFLAGSSNGPMRSDGRSLLGPFLMFSNSSGIEQNLTFFWALGFNVVGRDFLFSCGVFFSISSLLPSDGAARDERERWLKRGSLSSTGFSSVAKSSRRESSASSR